MMEVLIHAICVDVEQINQTKLLSILEVAHRELAAGLGHDDGIVKAFGEQQDRLRSLLIGYLIDWQGLSASGAGEL